MRRRRDPRVGLLIAAVVAESLSGLLGTRGGPADLAAAPLFSVAHREIPNALELLPSLLGPDRRFAPSRLSVDPLGALFALDRAQGQIQRWDPESGWIAFGVGAQGGPRSAHLIALEASWGTEILVLDATGPTLHRFDLDGHFSGSIDMGAEADRGVIDAVDVTLGMSGDLFLLDRAGVRLLQFDRDGRYLTDLLRGATGAQRPDGPTSLVRDRNGDAYVLDPVNGRVHRVTRQGALLPAWSCVEGLRPGSAKPGAMAALPRGGLAVVANDGSWIRLFGQEGELDYHGEIGTLTGGAVADLTAGLDDILYLARPSSPDVERVRIQYRGDTRDSGPGRAVESGR